MDVPKCLQMHLPPAAQLLRRYRRMSNEGVQMLVQTSRLATRGHQWIFLKMW